MIPDAVKYNFHLLMMSTWCSKHVEAFNKLIIKQDLLIIKQDLLILKQDFVHQVG